MIAISRIRKDPKTQAYVERKTAEGHSKLEIRSCLKRYIAREIYYLLRPAIDQAKRRDLTPRPAPPPQRTRRSADAVNPGSEPTADDRLDRVEHRHTCTGGAGSLDTQGSIAASVLRAVRRK